MTKVVHIIEKFESLELFWRNDNILTAILLWYGQMTSYDLNMRLKRAAGVAVRFSTSDYECNELADSELECVKSRIASVKAGVELTDQETQLHLRSYSQ